MDVEHALNSRCRGFCKKAEEGLEKYVPEEPSASKYLNKMKNLNSFRPQTAFNSGAVVFDLEGLGHTDTVTMLNFYILSLTTWTVELSVLVFVHPMAAHEGGTGVLRVKMTI